MVQQHQISSNTTNIYEEIDTELGDDRSNSRTTTNQTRQFNTNHTGHHVQKRNRENKQWEKIRNQFI